MNDVNDNNEILPLEEEKKKGFNKTILYIAIPLVLIIGVICYLYFKTNVITNILVPESERVSEITNVTYQGRDKYQIDSTSKFLVETKYIEKEDLNKYLAITPAYNYTIEKVSNNKFEITVDNIEANKIVEIDYVKNEKVDKGWAFQSNSDYKISSIYPADKSEMVSVNTGIDVTFTRPGTDLNEFIKHFSIEPKVEGNFSVYGRTITFVPTEELKSYTNYIITVTKGLKLGEDTIEEDYSFSFLTEREDDDWERREGIQNQSITNDNISTFKPGETPKIALYDYGYYYDDDEADYEDEDEDKDPAELVSKIVIEKFANASDFEKYIKGTTTVKRDSVGEAKFHIFNKDVVELDKGLNEGYYLLNVYNKKSFAFSVPVQINSLSAYLMNSERDLIVWVAKDGNLASNIEVTYESKKEKTNSDGIAVIRNISDGTGKLKYVKVNNGNNPVFVGVINDDLNNYPHGYVYTDKPIYKNTDEIKVWGYVPFNFFADEVNKNKFSIVFNEKNIPIKVDNNGNFETTIKLKNYESGYYDIYLNYNNTEIGYRYIDVDNYQLQNYVYEITTNKEFVEAGDKLNVTLKVKHVSNLPATNKDVSISFCGKTYKGTTDQSGEVSFTIKAIIDEDNYDTNYQNEYIEILGTAQDSDDWNLSYDIPIIYNKVMFDESKYDSKTKSYEVNIYNLDLKKKIDKDDILESLKGKAYNGQANLILVEEKSVRQEETEYNEYTKENETYYSWETEYKKNVIEKTINVSDGLLKYTIDYDFKDATKETYYEYYLYVIVKDSNNHTKKEYNWVYSNYEDEDEEVGPNKIKPIDANDSEKDDSEVYEYAMEDVNFNLNGDDYYYEYYANDAYSINDKINIKLVDTLGNAVINNNKVLQIKYKEKIISNTIKEANDISTTFEKSDVPGMLLTGAYYDGKNFYRMPRRYYNYRMEDSKISINITPSKKNYAPRDEVEVKIKTLDKDGKPIKSNLNISVVNESVFNLSKDTTDILETVYDDRYFGYYTFSTYRNYALYDLGGGKGGGDGEPRSQFGDTIYFKSASTDSNGEVTVKFKLNDSITSFRVTVHASTKEGSVGANNTKISSTLPLSIESSAPSFVKSSDDLVINATSLAPDNKKDKVKYTVEIKELNKKLEKSGIPGQSIYANFGKLKVGKYTVKISATQGKLKDALEYPVEIIESANEIKLKEESNIKNVTSIKPTKNPIYVEIYPEYLSKYLTYLDKLSNYNERLDSKIAYYKSLEYEKDFYNSDNNISVENFDIYKKDNMLKALRNAEPSEVLTALSLYYTNYFDINPSIYYETISKPDQNLSVIKSLLVLSAMKEPVLVDVNDYHAQTMEEYIYKTLAYLFLGDYSAAKTTYSVNIKGEEIEEDLKSLVAIIKTFVDRDTAIEEINKVLSAKESDNYIRFAIISYFENNQDELLNNEKVTISHAGKKEEVTINKYDITKLVLYDNDLRDISFESKSDKINVAYYYVGKVSELGNQVVENITISTSGKTSIGNTMYLNINLSKLKIDHQNIYVYLPNSLSLSPNASKVKKVGISKMLENKIVVSLSPDSPKKISVPLIVKLPGKYTFESVIMEDNGKYIISNETTFETK